MNRARDALESASSWSRDEALIGLDIVAGLEQAGAKVVGLVGTVKEALQSIESTSFEGALLDANLRGRQVDEVAGALQRRKVAFLFVSGYGREGLTGEERGFSAINFGQCLGASGPKRDRP
jgi:hypothetical protein